tara:strand:- start:1307 stop:1585 length:279 start_codon:yes stop_codon:yes gene_type:complete
MNIGPLPLKELSKKESEFKNIIIIAKRSRDIIESRFESIKVEEDIEDSEQLTDVYDEVDVDFDEPKPIVVALEEFKNDEIDWRNVDNELDND